MLVAFLFCKLLLISVLFSDKHPLEPSPLHITRFPYRLHSKHFEIIKEKQNLSQSRNHSCPLSGLWQQ